MQVSNISKVTAVIAGSMLELTESFLGKLRSWIRRCCPPSFFGTRPRGEMTVLRKGIVEKGPATRRCANSFWSLDRTIWGLRRTDRWVVYPADAGLWSMVKGIRKPSRNPRSSNLAEWKPESRDVKTGRLMGVGSRKGVLLGGRSLSGRAMLFWMPSLAACLADVGENASGDVAASVIVETVADPA